MAELSQGATVALAAVLGLMVGSFLNVVVYRLPVMMRRGWLAETLVNLKPDPDMPTLWTEVFGTATPPPPHLEEAASQGLEQVETLPSFSLVLPRSRCGGCGQTIAWYQNIPVLSWFALRGRCAGCGTGISLRYPLVEAFTGGLFALCAWRWGVTPVAGLWIVFGSLLICQFLIDLDTQYLPDTPNYLLLWLGLGGAALGWTGVPLSMAVWGAIAGYLCLWIVYQAYLLLTGKEGFGGGDFKLLAALGACLGADHLILIVLLSSVAGGIVGIGLALTRRLSGQAARNMRMAFGPFLAGAGLLCLAIGPQQVRSWLPFAFPFPLP